MEVVGKMITEEEKAILLRQQHEYYAFLPALFEIVKECKNRTIDFLSSKKEKESFGTRYCYAGTINFLKNHLEALGVSKGNKLINLYRSNALLSYVPPRFSYNLHARREKEDYQQFDKDYVSLIIGFDLIFDIDSPKKTMEDAYDVAKIVKAELDSFKVPYIIKPSGYKGFHLICPAEYMPKMPIEKLIKTIWNVLNNFRAIWFIEDYIDLSITNLKGLIKPCYALDSSFGVVSLPLNDYEFETFSVEKVKLDYVLKNVILKNRGNKLHTHGLTEEELKKNMEKFIKEYK